ncbi:MAG: mechanosensitive ion channel family protein [Tannerella sp.]|jgi:MscS family membrane protein|nr:mechanosensitive ion channel family protein [Tannerella sp.]
MLEQIFYGNTVESWTISAIIILTGYLLRVIAGKIYDKKLLISPAKKSKTKFLAFFFEALESPLKIGIILFSLWLALWRLDFDLHLKFLVARSFMLLSVLTVTWFTARLLTMSVEDSIRSNEAKTYHGKRIATKHTPLVKRSVNLIVWIVGIAIGLHNIGMEITTLLGTLGIGGIAFALAAQDTIKNVIGGVIILSDKPFNIGDRIKFDAIEGEVSDIGIRSTVIRTDDKRLVIIPNYKLLDSLITNIAKEPARRILMEIGLTYDTTPEKMEEALDILRNIPDRVEEVHRKDETASEHAKIKLDVIAEFTAYGDSALIITFIYYIKKSADIFHTRSKVNFEILRAFNRAGISFAFPTITITHS